MPYRLPQGVHFAVLKHRTLFLYTSEEQLESLGIFPVDGMTVELFPKGMFADEVWKKESPIRIGCEEGAIWEGERWVYLYAPNASEKEDWFSALRLSSTVGIKEDSATVNVEKLNEFCKKLNDSLHAITDDSTAQMINALIGRVFYNVHSCALLRTFFECKFRRKSRTMRKPFFLGDITLLHFDLGDSLPMISHGQLHSVAPNGELVRVHYFIPQMASVDVQYRGGMQMRIATQVRLEMSARMRPIVLPVELSVTIKRLGGRVSNAIRFSIGADENEGATNRSPLGRVLQLARLGA